ncbi:hypothetical protein GCM10018781_02730 [Kitasatospora indigofera]|uniref:Uncharacterized protein n=1 Tax=Kitasatospora indigofera TaxID=67307 RepID=A0A919KJN1_9ACTN|nr:hypothetical protein GCM10018781_02730 [Kitasatospora indigofera]
MAPVPRAPVDAPLPTEGRDRPLPPECAPLSAGAGPTMDDQAQHPVTVTRHRRLGPGGAAPPAGDKAH